MDLGVAVLKLMPIWRIRSARAEFIVIDYPKWYLHGKVAGPPQEPALGHQGIEEY